MIHFTKFTLEETVLKWFKDMGHQQIAFDKTDELMGLRDVQSLRWAMGDEVRVKDVGDKS